MRLTTTAASLLALAPSTFAYWAGFNVAGENPDGSCRTQAQWEDAFNRQRSIPQRFSTVRVFASSDCNTLANAVPAAIKTGTTILAGVWVTDAAHYDREKQALLSAVQQYGYDWLMGVSVGSEDLYRAQYQQTNEITPGQLAAQIHDVRGMLTTVGINGNIPIGHVDTWNVWIDPQNNEVIRACDFVGTDGYPYWQDAAIENSGPVFWDSVNAVRDVVNAVKPGIWVWITETGWPVSGETRGAAVANVQNLQTYWKTVACEALRTTHTFWYSLEDYNSDPSFGVWGRDGNPLIDFSC